MDKIAAADSRERADLFMDVAGRRPAIPASVMEKDFWVCWTLHRLFEALRFRPQLIFKGGTSLSNTISTACLSRPSAGKRSAAATCSTA